MATTRGADMCDRDGPLEQRFHERARAGAAATGIDRPGHRASSDAADCATLFLIIIDWLRETSLHGLPALDQLRRLGTSTTARCLSDLVEAELRVDPDRRAADGERRADDRQILAGAADSLTDRARASGLKVALATDYEVLPRLFLPPGRCPQATRCRSSSISTSVPIVETFERESQAPAAEYTSTFDEARDAPWPGGFVEAGTAVAAGDARARRDVGRRRGLRGPRARRRERGLCGRGTRCRSRGREDPRGHRPSRDAIIVTADHGHTDRGGHGGISPQAIDVPLVMAGRGSDMAPGSTTRASSILAPTAAALLGISAPGHGLGRTLVEALALDPARATVASPPSSAARGHRRCGRHGRRRDRRAARPFALARGTLASRPRCS